MTGIRSQDLPPAVRAKVAPQLADRPPPDPARVLRGHRAEAAGRDFEVVVEETFPAYLALNIARLYRMAVKTNPAPLRGERTRGMRIIAGPALFDVYGWFMDGARFVGAEIKTTWKKAKRLSIKPKGGLRVHQLDALAALAAAGGDARVVWRNGREYGVLVGADIRQAHERYYEGGRGARSIPWTWFRPIEWQATGGVIVLDWLQVMARTET